MKYIAMMIRGTVLNASAFTGYSYLSKYLSGDSGKAALEEKTQHDKALEAYQAAYMKCTHNRAKLLDWIQTNKEIKEQAKQNFMNTNYAFKLYKGPSQTSKSHYPKSPALRTFISLVSSRDKVSCFLWVAARSLAATRLSIFFE